MMSLRLGEVEVRVFEEARYLETVFADKTRVPACPHDSESYYRQAADLGYGEDVWAMCRDHEISHTLVAQAFGLPHSPTLWAVAHGKPKRTNKPGEMWAEEELVLAYQRWRNFRGEPIWA